MGFVIVRESLIDAKHRKRIRQPNNKMDKANKRQLTRGICGII